MVSDGRLCRALLGAGVVLVGGYELGGVVTVMLLSNGRKVSVDCMRIKIAREMTSGRFLHYAKLPRVILGEE